MWTITKLALTVLLAVILLGGLFAGTVLYFNGLIRDKSAQIVQGQSQIGNLTSQISDLQGLVANLSSQITNLTSPFLAASLEEVNMTNNQDLVQMFPQMPVTSIPYNSFWIAGVVNNTGHATAYNTGILVNAYSPDGILEVNMTVPLTRGVYGTDGATQDFIRSLPGYRVTIDGGVGHGGPIPSGSLQLGQIGSTYLGSLSVGQTANVTVAIYHNGPTVSNWTVTPVWTNSP